MAKARRAPDHLSGGGHLETFRDGLFGFLHRESSFSAVAWLRFRSPAVAAI
jgi:hypothetical protein